MHTQRKIHNMQCSCPNVNTLVLMLCWRARLLPNEAPGGRPERITVGE